MASITFQIKMFDRGLNWEQLSNIYIFFLNCLQVVISDDNGFIQVFNENNILLLTFRAHLNGTTRLKVHPKGYLASSSKDNSVKIWNTTDWKLITTYTGHSHFVYGLEFIGDDTIASASWDTTIQIWSIKTGKHIKTLNVGVYVSCVILLTNGLLASGDDSGRIKIWNLTNSSIIATLDRHSGYVYDLALVNEQTLASASADKTVIIWNLTSSSRIFTLIAHTHYVYGLKLIKSNVLASSSLDKTINIWDLTNGRLLQTLNGHTGSIYNALNLLDEDTLISGSLDKTLKFWRISTGQLSNSITTGLNIRSLAILANLTDGEAEYSSADCKAFLF